MSNTNSSAYTDQEARDKNIDEYNATAGAYTRWSNENIQMQNQCYYSTFNELEKEGIEGKTFLEVGCGPCPIGRKLVEKHAKKVIGLDISSEMIEFARRELTELGIVDKFELVCKDIFDEDFELSEKVDCVVISYVLSTFITNHEQLVKILD